jgi:hypothetical protein
MTRICGALKVLDTPTEGTHRVVTVPRYILTKFLYFGAVLGDVIFSFNKRKNCFHVITILYGKLYTLHILGIWISCLLHMNCTIRFFYFVSFFLSFSLHLRTKAVSSPNFA